MKHLRTLILSATVFSAAMAHAETAVQPARASNNTLDDKIEVAYTCQGGNKQAVDLTAMYGIKDNEVIVAQVRVAGQTSPGMWRVPDVLVNRFVSQEADVRPTMWTTLPANAQNISQVDGGRLSYSADNTNEHTLIVDNCKLNAAATARLNR